VATPASTVEDARLEGEIRAVGETLIEALPPATKHPMRAVDDRAMQLSSRDAELRAALFRLVDVTPACRSLDDLSTHLVAFAAEVPERPASLDVAMKAANTKAGRVALGAAVAAGVRHVAHRFIAGESPREALGELRRLWDGGVTSSVDLLGEATLTSEEADAYARRCADAIETLVEATASFPARPTLERDPAGPVPRANLSIKVTALTPLIKPESPRRGLDDAALRLRPLLRTARDSGAHLHVDMESLDTRETTLELIGELLAEAEFAQGPSVGVVVQAYLRDSPGELADLLAWTRGAERATPLTVRLVKGAYWDHELVESRQHGWQAPVFEEKSATDRNFEALTRTLVDEALARPGDVRVAIGSHNLRSIANAVAYNRLRGGPDSVLEVQVLRGLGDDLAEAVAATGLRARSYCPVGELVAGMAYLVRRLLENTANESFLAARAKGAAPEELLARP
jgi:RHH-type proline utilization regulon transcriptional repressor/proline dehydrogenase/delta 1-pyrroline-5-carboxylate dehydrogenase